MFKQEKNVTFTEKGALSSATLISAGTILKGDLNSENDLRIDGAIYGNVSSSAKVVVGPSGHVEGNIFSNGADITGKVCGNISVKDLLQLRGQCTVEGNIAAIKLQIDPTAIFNGKCKMGPLEGSVVIMNNQDVQAAEAK